MPVFIATVCAVTVGCRCVNFTIKRNDHEPRCHRAGMASKVRQSVAREREARRELAVPIGDTLALDCLAILAADAVEVGRQLCLF